jgi:hypothetical protein
MKPSIHPFIFTWNRQFEKACVIEDALKRVLGKVTVINSDEHNSREGWINIGDASYFSDQFRKALELFDGDILFHIQADVSYDRWSELVEDAQLYFQYYDAGIYAPNVDYSWWTPERNDIEGKRLDHDHLRLVACSDETVWFIRKEVLQGMRERGIDLSRNTMGWGWDCMLAAISYSQRRPVIRDYNHTITHPQGTAYNIETAMEEMNRLVDSLDPEIKTLYSLIRGDRELLVPYLAGGLCYQRHLGTHKGYTVGQLAQKRLPAYYDLSSYRTFVETGTFKGDGVAWAIEQGFEKIYSVEVSKELFDAARERFKDHEHVTIVHGDSPQFLSDLSSRVSGPAFFYLDAHWSGAYQNTQTGFAGSNLVPLKEESVALSTYRDIGTSLIAIDDERLMVDPVNPPASWGLELKTWLLDFWCRQHGCEATFLDDTMILEKKPRRP